MKSTVFVILMLVMLFSTIPSSLATENSKRDQGTYRTIERGWVNFSNSSTWKNLQRGWVTFGNKSSWHSMQGGWVKFGKDDKNKNEEPKRSKPVIPIPDVSMVPILIPISVAATILSFFAVALRKLIIIRKNKKEIASAIILTQITFIRIVILERRSNDFKIIYVRILICPTLDPNMMRINGRGGIRTRDHWLRRPAPYPG